MSNILNLQQIMNAQDVTEKTVEIPEWDGSVVVKSISHRTMRDIKKAISAELGPDASDEDVPEDELEKWIVIKGMIQPSVNEEEYESLLDKSYSAMQTIVQAILGSSKSGEKAIKESERTFPAEPERVRLVQPSGTVGDDSRAIADGITSTPESL